MAELLSPARVPVWYFRWETAPRLDVTLLSADERDRYAAFRFDRDRDSYLLAHTLLRRVLSHHEDVPETSWLFECNSYGKPFIVSPSSCLHFSLTHTASMVACAISLHSEIGVDAERIDRTVEFMPLARRYFASAEAATLECTPPLLLPERFFTLWTLKEAYIKARGMGLSLPLDEFEVHPQDSGAATIVFLRPEGADASDWHLQTFPLGPHMISAAVRAPSPPEFVLRDGASLLYTLAS